MAATGNGAVIVNKSTRHWYLVYCKAKAEYIARDNLVRQGYQVYLPLMSRYKQRARKLFQTVEPLFSRYLFVRLDTEADNWSPIRSTLGVANIVRFGQTPAPTPSDLITELKSREKNQDAHRFVDLANLKKGDEVRINAGAMAGYAGQFLQRNSQDRVIVLLNIMEQQSRVSLPADAIGSIH